MAEVPKDKLVPSAQTSAFGGTWSGQRTPVPAGSEINWNNRASNPFSNMGITTTIGSSIAQPSVTTAAKPQEKSVASPRAMSASGAGSAAVAAAVPPQAATASVVPAAHTPNTEPNSETTAPVTHSGRHHRTKIHGHGNGKRKKAKHLSGRVHNTRGGGRHKHHGHGHTHDLSPSHHSGQGQAQGQHPTPGSALNRFAKYKSPSSGATGGHYGFLRGATRGVSSDLLHRANSAAQQSGGSWTVTDGLRPRSAGYGAENSRHHSGRAVDFGFNTNGVSQGSPRVRSFLGALKAQGLHAEIHRNANQSGFHIHASIGGPEGGYSHGSSRRASLHAHGLRP